MTTKTSTTFAFACKLSDLKPNVPYPCEVNDRFVVLAMLDGQVFCIEDICTHDGGTIGDGELEGNCLVCPKHGAKFDLKSGDAMSMPATEGTLSHEVEIRGDEVFVHLKDN